MRILIINGPNLNLLGRRQPEIYGTSALDDIIGALRLEFPDVEFRHIQTNHEGVIIDTLQQADEDAVILNAGGFTHTSVAIADAVAAIGTPVVEVHISNVHAREEFRRLSMLSPVCAGTISGFGPAVYSLGVRAAASLCDNRIKNK